jgi:hypothetical protein
VRKGQDQEEEEMGPRVAEIWVSTGEAGNRLRWESIKGVQIVRDAEGISFQGPGEDNICCLPRIPFFPQDPFLQDKNFPVYPIIFASRVP